MNDISHFEDDITPKQAIALQKRLAQQVVLTDQVGNDVKWLAGVDVGFEQANTITRAAVVILDREGLRPCYGAIARLPTHFPYIPGLLSFREIPALLKAFQLLPFHPDLVLCDGQGIAHPRRFGIACHLGVLLDLPTIGVAKSRLCGRHDEVGEAKGELVRLMDKEEQIGVVLRSRDKVKPLYISPGHRIDMAGSVTWVMETLTRYRLPETTRWAHRLASGDLQRLPDSLQLFEE